MDVRDRATYYLNIKPRTRAELERYLKKKGYEDEEIEKTLIEMEEYNYINDLVYCKDYFDYGFSKRRGFDRIKRELREKGVKPEVIEQAEYEMDQSMPDQFEIALEIGREMTRGMDISSMDYNARQKLQGRIGRRLASRGFRTDIIYKVIRQVVDSSTDEF